MYRFTPAGVGLLFLFSASVASAAIYYNQDVTSQACTATQPCGTQGKVITFYVPHGGVNCASSVQGCVETSRVGLDGENKPISVDAVRLGKAKYATCASDPSNYGKYFNMGTITYRSALDQQMYTVPNVICYVHDTGGAFRGRPDKLDLATTICATCTEAQAHAIGIGGQVNLVGQGPIDTNRNASIFRAALANLGAGPATIGWGTGVGGDGQVLAQDYYCVTSIEPVIVVNLPAGSTFPSSGCYNQPPAGAMQRQATNPFNQAANRLAAPTPSTQGSGIGTNRNTSITSISPLRPSSPAVIHPAALLVAQPKTVRHGDPILVSWSSVGMSTQSLCQVSDGGDSIPQKNSGSQIITTTLSQVGTLTFTLSCTTQAGAQVQQSATVTVN